MMTAIAAHVNRRASLDWNVSYLLLSVKAHRESRSLSEIMKQELLLALVVLPYRVISCELAVIGGFCSRRVGKNNS